MLASATLALGILGLAISTAGSADLDSLYGGGHGVGHMTPGEVVRSLKGEGKPARFSGT